mgnify:CR=1 FL=1
MPIRSDPLDELAIPDGTTVEEHDLVTDGDVIVGGQSTVEFGVRGDDVMAGERVTFDGHIEAEGDCRLDMWSEVEEDVLVGGDAYLGERARVGGELKVAGNVDIGDDVDIEQSFEASGHIEIRNPMPTVVFLVVYLSQLLRIGEEEAAEDLASELVDADEEEDQPVVIPRGARVSDDAWRVSTPATVGDDCRLHGNIRAESLAVGEDNTIFGSLRARGDVTVGAWTLPAWWLVFLGLFLAQAWKSFGLGATFAIVKQSVPPERLAMGFASTEVFRRIGFLVGPLAAAALLATTATFVGGFQRVLLLAVACGLVATVAQHLLYDASEDTLGKSFEGVGQVLRDLRTMPATLRPLLVADTLIRFANGMVYVFFVIVVTDFLAVGFTGFGVSLRPDAFFGVLLGVEMVVAVVSMAPVSKFAEWAGLKPAVALGFLVYATFPLLLIVAPADQWLVLLLFAFSGLRFAGLPAHKALIVGPAERNAGGRVTGTYYLVRNVVVVPSAALGGWLYGSEWALTVRGLTLRAGPELAFGTATAVGLVGVAYFLAFGREFEAYA